MRLAKLCITLTFALGGWHGALAAAICARHADCRATADSRDPHAHPQHHPQTAGRVTPNDANAADKHVQTATRAAADHASDHDHCGSSSSDESVPHEIGGSVSSENDGSVSPENGENASPESVADPRAPASPCAHCVGRQTTQPVSVNSAAPSVARDSHAAHAPARQLVALPAAAARARFSPPAHSPPRARPLHLLNSVLLI